MAMFLLAGAAASDQQKAPAARWWKGCLHAHTLWSDGDVFPETAIDWYKRHGYNFLALTDHNQFQEGRRWLVEPDPKTAGPGAIRKVATPAALAACRKLMGAAWVDECTSGGKRLVRLKTLDEIRPKFEEFGRFLLLPGEEITANVHLNAFNLSGTIAPPKLAKGQGDPAVWMARTMTDLVERQARAAGRRVLVQLNHPGWARSPMTIDEVARVDCLNLMEINNDDAGASASLPQTERMWDEVLARRLAAGRPPMLVTAGDDTHEYLGGTMPDGGLGHGWVMVRAAQLTTESLLSAMDAGDFYASSGVTLADLKYDGHWLALAIEPREGDRFVTEFIGMRRHGKAGETLATATGLNPVYEFKGDEIYVRARVTSSRLRTVKDMTMANEMAWTQAFMAGTRAKAKEGAEHETKK